MAAALFGAALAHAGPEARVRVRGSARLQAVATTTDEGFELRGTLLDDAGKPVPDARVRVRLIGRDGSLRLLPRPESCGRMHDELTNQPYRGSEDVVASTDPSGSFCVRWALALPDGRLVVTYDESGSLLDPTELSVKVDRSESVELGFVPVPRTLSLDDAEVAIALESRARRDAFRLPQPLVLEWSRAGAPTTLLARRELRPGDALRISLKPQELGAPGTGVLSATLGGSERLAEARAPVILTVLAEIHAPAAIRADSSGGATLAVAVRSRVGPVEGGSVEAMQSGRTVGIAPVVSGRSRLTLSVVGPPGVVPIKLRYLPAAPWWVPGAERGVEVTIATTSGWRRLPWVLGLLAVLAWVVAAWRRPARAERTRPLEPEARAPQPDLTWMPIEGSASGWRGVVSDAHDGSAIEGASIELALDDATRLRATSDRNGEFRVDAPTGGPYGGSVRIEARWHSSLERPLPPEGRLSIALVTRRRMLILRLVEWATRRGSPFSSGAEPTPGELAGAAEANAHPEISKWARAVEIAAFGPTPVDETEEARVRSLEPRADGRGAPSAE